MTPPLPKPPLPPSLDPQDVPPLEPPAPLAFRLSSRARLRDTAAACRRWVPSWLASFVVHVAFVVLVASLVLPDVPGNIVLQLIGGFDDAERQKADVVPLVEAPQMPARAEEEPTITAPAEAAAKPATQKDEPPPAASDKPPAPPAGTAKLAAAENPAAEPTSRTFEPAAEPAVVVAKGPPGNFGPLASGETRAIATRTNSVVDRFILYDINELRGQAGQQALADFEKLGPEAIPALVRGLNKATTYRNSCPAIVIGRALDAALEKSRDPTSIRYAVDNIGRGVSADGNHLGVLQGLLAKWGNLQDRLRSELRLLASDEVPITDEMLNIYQDFKLASLDVLQQATEADNPAHRLVALVCLRQRVEKGALREVEQVMTAERVMGLLEEGGELECKLAHRVLVHLAKGQDFGQSAAAWRQHFAQRREQNIVRRADSALRLAKQLDDSGRTEAATTRYRQLVREYPGTEAAKEAQGILAEGRK